MSSRLSATAFTVGPPSLPSASVASASAEKPATEHSLETSFQRMAIGEERRQQSATSTSLRMTKTNSDNSLHKVPEDDDTAIAFVDKENNSFIECYADSIAIVNGVEYTIGSPCDHAVALCYFDDEDQLLPVELDEDLMDEIFPLAATIVEEEFGEELSLERTPQTLTLVGELEEIDDEEEDEDDGSFGDEQEDVEILLSFEEGGTEYCLVRLLDPVLLVGKAASDNENKCVLLTPQESDNVMPLLEEMFLDDQTGQ
jgi:hypothetical protein